MEGLREGALDAFLPPLGAPPMIRLPRPRLLRGIEMIAAEPSPEQEEAVAGLVERAERIRNGGLDPREDNMLAVTNDGRKVALDMRVMDPSAPDFAGSKVNQVVRNARSIWEETRDERLTQLIFCDLSKPVAAGRGFSVYNDIREKLLASGVPADEVAFIHDAKTDARKARLFADMREGRVRILLGSTQKMGMGTNVQDLLFALHHLDAPWRPADIEQREGRMLRRGNRNSHVRVLRYVTQRTFDAYMWQTLEYKARMIAQIMCGELAVRRIEDLDTPVLSFAQIKALASGNPMVMEKAGVDADVARLTRAKRAFEDRRFTVRMDLAQLPERVRHAEEMAARIRTDMEARVETRGERFRVEIDGREYLVRAEAGAALRRRLIEVTHTSATRRSVRIGAFAGFALEAAAQRGFHPELILRGQHEHTARVNLEESSAAGNLRTLEALPRRMEEELVNVERNIAHIRQQLDELRTLAKATFKHTEELNRLVVRQRELDALLGEQAEERRVDLHSLGRAEVDSAEDEAA